MSQAVALPLRGLLLSRWIGLASTTLLLYDHAINLADEVKHFWSGPWTFSRGMYFGIRYLGFMQVVVLILSNCTHAVAPVLSAYLLFVIEIAVMVLCQGAITTRVWYMFTHRPIIKIVVVMAYIATTAATTLIAGVSWPYVRTGLPTLEAQAVRTFKAVWIYIPSLSFHSFVFILKVFRFATSPRYLQTDTLLWRFLKEGMAIYACALASLLFVVIGLTMTGVSQIPVYDTAFTGGVTFVALTVVSVCHAMLSIKSLAATAHVDPGWLLNHAEMSRVHWRQGATEGEIVVEMPDDSFELPLVAGPSNDAKAQ